MNTQVADGDTRLVGLLTAVSKEQQDEALLRENARLALVDSGEHRDAFTAMLALTNGPTPESQGMVSSVVGKE